MKVALVGFRGSGKTTVFNALTGQSAETGFGKKGSSNLGRIQVPDARIDKLTEIYQPKKTTRAEIQFVDVAGQEDADRGSGTGLDPALVSLIREADALDNVQVEKRIERLKKEKRGPELELMEKLLTILEEGQALRRHTFAAEELNTMSGFGFLSMKPVLCVLNQGEDDIGNEPPADVVAAAKEREVDLISMCATMEAEIMAMEPDDQAAFLADYGLSEPMRTRFISAAYNLLDLISFLTTGEDEVRAWTIHRGTNARAAAGKIHSDLERGFIRAEVTAYDDFIALGSEAKVKEAGKLRLEGKEYIVKDGDIMHVRHNS